MNGRRLLSRPTLVLLLGLASACFSQPAPTLRTRMIDQEIALDSLEKALRAGEDAEALVAEAQRILSVSRDPAFERFRERPAVRQRLKEFDAFRATYVQHSEAIEAAAQADDRDRVQRLIGKLRASCDACHAVFRPGI